MTVNSILLVFLFVFLWKGYQIFEQLYVPDREALTGEFKGAEQSNAPVLKMANNNTFFGMLQIPVYDFF